ncbi:hypothetical protein AB0F25_30500 [Streptomyces wedmorensis]|uniref:hypothetical protein n=1 Tax=Streptomyces wedmorensis TaxID=43759 RepID=UPI00344734E8
MPYSDESDLLLGQVPLPSYISAAAYISNAAEEIDAVIGMTYVTPVSLQETPENRASILILKKANNFLASGRIIMAVDAGGQESELHKYGQYLVRQAEAIIKAIKEGEFQLVGAVRLNPELGGTAPIIHNADSESIVDAYYDNFNRSNYPLPRRRVSFGEHT